jgi:GH24 family phage-related lysozyme (muramidase)
MLLSHSACSLYILPSSISIFAEHPVEQLVTVPLSQGQNALVSFTYDEGAGRLWLSTLLKVLNVRFL